MQRIGRILGRFIVLLAVIGAVMWLFGPYERVDLKADFEPRKFGEGVQVYFESVESGVPDVTPGTEKRVIWAGQQETRTPYSVLYVHGFSATSEEIRPVPDRIAATLGANLVYTRLRGHGRDGAAMAGPTVNDWMQDTAEGLAAARAVGDRVIVISTSTGGALAAAVAVDPDLSRDVVGMIFVSPNFAIKDPASALLTWPAARYWVPLLIGETRSFEPSSDAQAKYWTTSYPVVALMPMAALAKAASTLEFPGVKIPGLFWYSEDDQVVNPKITAQVAALWGGPVTVNTVTMGPGDDANAHVITGDIKSPGQTEPAIAGMLDWLKSVGIE